jgi:hypothetical protein
MNWNGRSEVEARDVLSMVKNNWRGKEEKEKRREGEGKEEMDFIAWGKIE